MRNVALLARVKDFPVGMLDWFAKRRRIINIERLVVIGLLKKFEFLKLSVQEIKLVIVVELRDVIHDKRLSM